MKSKRPYLTILCPFLVLILLISCITRDKNATILNNKTASEILGNKKYQAISYGGYRAHSRDIQPTVAQLKEDMKILAAMDIRLLRTYNTKLAHTSNLLRAIRELKNEDKSFEMYVMLGAWIDCKNAWTDQEPDHQQEDEKANAAEIDRAVRMANTYPDIIKIIAVGNEAMVKWATSYYVQPGVILKWVNHLQNLKRTGELSKDLWITSSDNFASWGGGDAEYHVEDLKKLIKAVDFISVHTYPMHDTHYNPDFWGITESECKLSNHAQIEQAMKRALSYAQMQYESTKEFISTIDDGKAIHIGETGWASFSNGHYGPAGSRATDEYKQWLYYTMIRDWTNEAGISCFYFEAFDEPWKDAQNPGGSENHFGLFTVDGKAKRAIWDKVDQGTFNGLTRGGNIISKTFQGDLIQLAETVKLPPLKNEELLEGN